MTAARQAVGDLAGLGVAELRQGYESRAFSVLDVVGELVELAEQRKGLGALIRTCDAQARSAARRADERLVAGTARPLEGIPFAIKDLIDTAEVATEYGSPIFEGNVPAQSAELVQRLEAAGAIALAKTRTHEFGWGISTVSDHDVPARNPWNIERIAGGSSGGSAVAVAAGLSPLALGTDTAGSIRIPADFCGIVGFKPSRHLLPRGGIFPLAPSLDHPGLMARTPRDLSLALGVLTRRACTDRDEVDPAGLRIGISADLDAVSPDSLRAETIARMAGQLKSFGAEIVELEMPRLRDSYAVLSAIVLAEGLVTHRRAGIWPERRTDYGADVRGRLERADSTSPEAYVEALRLREEIGDEFARAFGSVDLLLGASSAVGPSAVETPSSADFRQSVMSCTAPQSLTGVPACVVRAGFDSEGMPHGVQLCGPVGADALVLAVCQLLFDATPEVQSRTP